MAIMKFEKPLLRAASVMAVTSLVSDGASRKRGTGAHSFVSLLIMSAVPTPQFGAVRKVGEARERRDVRNREPVARGLHFADLRADVLRQVRKRITLADA